MEIKTAKVIQTSTTQYIHITLKTNSSDIHYFLLDKTLSSASSSSKTSKGSSDPLTASGYNIMVNLTGGNVTAFDVYFEPSTLKQFFYSVFYYTTSSMKTATYLIDFTLSSSGGIID